MCEEIYYVRILYDVSNSGNGDVAMRFDILYLQNIKRQKERLFLVNLDNNRFLFRSCHLAKFIFF